MKHSQREGAQGSQLLLMFDPHETNPTTRAESPHSLRRVAVNNDFIAYRLQRVRRRTIGFHIDDSGLTVRAPRWITLRNIEAAIVENQRWILAKQVAWRNWRNQQPRMACLADGGAVQYLGTPTTMRWIAEADASTYFDDGAREIRLALRSGLIAGPAAEVAVRDELQMWFQAQARAVFAQRLIRFEGRFDARYAGWRLSSARTLWGSCSHDGSIRLNWRLMHFALPVIDYVIAHELAHLRELNHSVRFWRVVSQLLPGFESARDQIKRVDIRAVLF
ncbi:MAG: SprT family zinc-dependent metalloprotease [Burkholderiaceae bacterium]